MKDSKIETCKTQFSIPTSFMIVEKENVLYLKVFLSNADLSGYERLQFDLQKNYTIRGQIDISDNLALAIKAPEMAVMMAVYMLKHNWANAKSGHNLLLLSRFIIKVFPFIIDKKYEVYIEDLQPILIEKYDLELSKYNLLSNIAKNLGYKVIPEKLSFKHNKRINIKTCKVLLQDVTSLLRYSTHLCPVLINEVMSHTNACNEIAYRAVFAVEAIQKIKTRHAEELLCLFNACFEGNVRILEKMQGDIEGELTRYLHNFKVPETLIQIITDGKQDNRNNVFFSDSLLAKKISTDLLDVRSEHISELSIYAIKELAARVSQLNNVRETAEIILNNYDIFREYTQQLPCVICLLLPESNKLLSPLFHKYNSCNSPLISALCDRALDQATNLQLFSDLAKAKPYQQRKLNITIYGEGQNYFHSEFMSPLCYAVEDAIPDVVRILLENKATVNPVDNRKTPLHRAMLRGEPEIVKLLLEFGARPDMVTDDEGLTALHHVRSAECAAYLIDWVAVHSAKYPNINHNSFINARDRQGNTPLISIAHRQVLYSKSDAKKSLDKVEIQSQQHLRLIQLFIDKGADLDAVNHFGHCALHYALMLKAPAGVMHMGFPIGNSMKVHIPTAVTAVKILVDAGADVNIVTFKQPPESQQYNTFPFMTPLLAIYDSDYLESVDIFLRKSEQCYIRQIVEMLIKKGALINICDRNFMTPLSKSILVGDDDTVAFLLKNDARPNLRSNKTQPTPLHYCMSTMNRKSVDSEIKCLEHLLHAGASPLLSIDVTLELKFVRVNSKSVFSVTSNTMQLILSQKNEFSEYVIALQITDKEESIEERFLRIWSAINVHALKVTVQMNPLDYSYYTNKSVRGPHSQAVELFNKWLNFYHSQDVILFLTVFCLSPLWVHIKRDLVIYFAKNFSSDPMQIKCLITWILTGRQLLKSQDIQKESLSQSTNTYSTFFYHSGVLKRTLENTDLVGVKESNLLVPDSADDTKSF